MKRCLIIDSYYPDFVNKCPVDRHSSYSVELRRILDKQFGTADYYSKNLARYGFECADIIANHAGLQDLWAREHMCHGDILRAQIEDFAPDCVFFQDLSLLTADELSELGNHYLLAGQCSCPLPPIQNVQQFDVLFTSFPFYVKKFKEVGVRGIFNPLGFEPAVLDMLPKDLPRIHDVTFVGGTGNPSHWKRGMETLHAVAEAIPTFKWWGYGQDLLPDGPLKQKYMGQAWGLDMFRILLQSKVCLNRHGEVTEGYANNMRMFEASGAGCLLLTEEAPNLKDFFAYYEAISYDSPRDTVQQIQHYLKYEDERQRIAANGQRKTLSQHTYQSRMRTVSDTLLSLL